MSGETSGEARLSAAGLSAAGLRRAFDAGFAEPPAERQALRGLLAVRVGNVRYVLPPEQIGGVLRCPALTPLPGARRGLLGLARIRSTLVAVYSLGALLGDPEARPGEWLVVGGAGRSLALSFDALEGFHQVPERALTASSTGRPWVELGGQGRELLDLAGLFGELEGKTGRE